MMNVKNSNVVAGSDSGYFFNGNMMFDRWGIYPVKNGTWRVCLVIGPEANDFMDIGNCRYRFGVMDDFGNLVKVEA